MTSSVDIFSAVKNHTLEKQAVIKTKEKQTALERDRQRERESNRRGTKIGGE